jgi:hypothetical protein
VAAYRGDEGRPLNRRGAGASRIELKKYKRRWLYFYPLLYILYPTLFGMTV